LYLTNQESYDRLVLINADRILSSQSGPLMRSEAPHQENSGKVLRC
jgi:hypothetical protein